MADKKQKTKKLTGKGHRSHKLDPPVYHQKTKKGMYEWFTPQSSEHVP